LVGVGELGGELLGMLQVSDGFSDLTAHGVSGGEVDHVPGLAFG
jgi:hypothetical protein